MVRAVSFIRDMVKFLISLSHVKGSRVSWVRGSVFFVLIFALPSLSSPSPLCGAILKRKQAPQGFKLGVLLLKIL